MPNPIKYTTGSETNALKKGNFYIGTGAVGKGPSDTTGYYQGPSVPSNGYVIYMNKVGAPGGLSYHSAANDSELISFTNSLAGESFTTTQQCFNYYYGQTDKVLVTQDYPADFPYIVLDGLVVYLDAGITQSYSGSGTVWTNINGLGPKNNGTLVNGPTFSTDGGGSIVFDGVDDYVNCGSANQILSNTYFTMECWMKSSDNGEGSGSQGTFIGTRVGRNASLARFGGSNTAAFFWDTITEGNLNLNSNTVVFNGEWHHIVGTFDNGLGSIYVDGEFKNSASSTSPIDLSATAFGIGVDPSNLTRTFYGKVSIGRVYNRALSSSEILQNYNAQKGRFGL